MVPALRISPGSRDRFRVIALPLMRGFKHRNRYRVILEFRWLSDNPMTLEELGTRCKISSTRIRQFARRFRNDIEDLVQGLIEAAPEDLSLKAIQELLKAQSWRT